MDKEIKTIELKGKFVTAIGRRKSAVAQVRLYKSGQGKIIINGLAAEQYFPISSYLSLVLQPLKATGLENKADILIVIHGGGKRGQAEATRHGIARALLALDRELKPKLKAERLLTRDPRKKERKKPGLKKARKAEQWQKR